MDKKVVGYWILTVLVAFSIGSGGIMDLTRAEQVVTGMAHLGLPAYMCTLIGIWKVLGTVAILVPKFPRLKEWAYAGIVFDLTGAAFCHASSGDGVGDIVTPLIIAAMAMGSWALRPDSKKLASA